ncbi:MAG: Bax inhibitor-1/YccA family protein [Rickettsiales bacterium]
MEVWNRSSAQSQSMARDEGMRAYMLRVYNYMTSGVLLTGVIAYFASQSETFLGMMITQGADGRYGMSGLGWIIALAPVAMAFFLAFRVNKMTASQVQTTFWAYASLMGLSLFSIFLIYTGASILKVFFITAGTFGLLSMYGYTTKKDLTSWGTFLSVGVLAVFVVSLANVFFFKASGLDLALSYVGVFLALGLTAYDTQKIKEIYYSVGHDSEAVKKASALGALSLYFDFIYLFINLLRIMGDRR